MDTKSARSRAVAAMVASLALLGSSAAITAAPAQSAPPPDGDCAEGLPVAAVEAGMAVDTLTVTKGTVPQRFDGEVIEVLDNGIAPGIDMIIADFGNQSGNENNDTEIDKAGGIWQGMSGSPVYDSKGKLLGAVAYGLSWGPSTVAGITPYEHMDDYLPPAETQVPRATARTIAAETEVTARQASNGMKQLRVPLTINGLTQVSDQSGKERLKALRSADERNLMHKQGSAGTLVGTADAAAAAPGDIVDGGNLGAAISYGTITFGGVGTVTDVCGDDVVGFGHPMMFSGATSMGLMPADALYVQPETLGAPFKVANLAAPAGTITQDRLAGITGTLSALPQETDIASTVVYNDEDPATPERSGEGLSHSLAKEWHADVTLIQMLSMHDVTIDAIQPGSETSGVVVEGTSRGKTFRIASDDRFVSDWDIAFASLWSTADLVYAVSRLNNVEITGITTDSDVTDSTDTLRVGKLQQRRGGTWATIGRREPAVVRAGGVLTMRTQLKGAEGSKWLKQRVRVPSKARNGGRLQVTGGAWTWNNKLWQADTLEEVKKAVKGDVRNDEVETQLRFWSRRSDTNRRVVSRPQKLVVEGNRSAPVVVRR